MSVAETLGVRSYRELFAGRDARRVISWGLLARMPTGMASLAFVLLVRGEGGSYTTAGIVSGAYTVAAGAGAVVGGRLVDRRRPAPVLMTYGILYGVALAGLLALAHARSPEAALIASALVAGALAPPVGPTIRMMWPAMLPRPELRTTAFALEATIQEVIFVAGPLIVAALAATISPSAGVAAAALACLAGTAGFIATPAVRARRPDTSHDRTGQHPFEALLPWGVRRVLLVGLAYGVAFGAAEVSMPAFAEGHGGRSLGGIALAAFSGGSLVGGVLAGAASASGSLDRRLQAISAIFALVLVPPLLAGSLVQMTAVMFVAGLPIAPSVAVAYNLLERAARRGTQAEVFGWMSTAVTAGIAVGTAGGGSLIAHVSVRPALALAVVGAVVACVITFAPADAAS
jgi:predicted MFS family arabinose efflux permease